MTNTPSNNSSALAKTGSALSGFFTGSIFRWLLVVIGVLGMAATFVVMGYVQSQSRNLPLVDTLAEYKPEVTSRVHAGDGRLIAEFASEHRVYIPYDGIPEHVIQAFVSAEDKNFFSHSGLDYFGMMRAGIRNVRDILRGVDGNLQGGSTITQQVAKNMLLADSSQKLERKVREAILAKRMEKAFTKAEIAELYLNEIYLGGSSYGVASAALNYFNKSLPDLSLEEAAVLAAMAQRPGDVNPFRKAERSRIRRNWVLGRMAKNGFITNAEAREAQDAPLETRSRLKGAEYAAATYFVEELRRDLIELVGEDELKEDGLSIRSTLDTRLQIAAQDALRAGLETYDRRKGFRGPLTHIELGDEQLEKLNAVELPGGYGTREAALVLSASDSAVRLLLTDGYEIDLASDDVTWSRTYRTSNGSRGLSRGDVVMVGVEREIVSPEGSEETNPAGDPVESQETVTGLQGEGGETADPDMISEEEAALENRPVGEARLGQIPLVEGALLALDPHTGRILAMAGGYSFWKSQFNRTTQAKRQPGSSFKPLVYASALELGYPRSGQPAYTPASKILDAPFIQCDYSRVSDQCYAPTNYTSGRFYGMSTMRLGLEKSRNAMTVRLANDIGMEHVAEFSERIGLYDHLDPYLSMSLGAGEVTVFDMAKSYALLVNGGKKVTPTLFDRVQDRNGDTIFKSDSRECEACEAEYEGQAPPVLADNREQVIDPIVAFQIAYILQGVVERGTAAGIRRDCPPGGPQAGDVEGVPEICKHTLGGKTGTTNDYNDAWFMGFSPDLVVGIYVGFDEPKTLGGGESGGRVAAPIFADFMEDALKGRELVPLRAPSGVRFVNIDARTGELPGAGTSSVIREAFRKGSEPGYSDAFYEGGFDLYGGGVSSGNDDGASDLDLDNFGPVQGYGDSGNEQQQPYTPPNAGNDFEDGVY